MSLATAYRVFKVLSRLYVKYMFIILLHLQQNLPFLLKASEQLERNAQSTWKNNFKMKKIL